MASERVVRAFPGESWGRVMSARNVYWVDAGDGTAADVADALVAEAESAVLEALAWRLEDRVAGLGDEQVEDEAWRMARAMYSVKGPLRRGELLELVVSLGVWEGCVAIDMGRLERDAGRVAERMLAG